MKTLTNDRLDETLVGRWQLDPQRSSVEFRARHFWGLGTVKGHFDDYEGRLDLSADPAIELTIDAAHVQTGNPKRDQHLRSAEFFDAENHPSVQFVSNSVVLRGDTLRVRGELEIEAAASAPHRELGMTWNPLGMIPPHSELHVTGYLVPTTAQAA